MALGITILVAFSLGATAFALYDPKRFVRPELPPNLGQWQPIDGPPGVANHIVEQRIIVVERGWFRRRELVRQVRTRYRDSREILDVAPEQVIKGPPWI